VEEVETHERIWALRIELRYFREKRGGINDLVEGADFARLEPLLGQVRQAIATAAEGS